MSRETWTIVGVGVALPGLIVALGAVMSAEHAGIRAEIRENRVELSDINQRVAGIDGYLFGLEKPEPVEDEQ